MTNPLTTPSGVEQSIPIPRNADGSPMTKAQARIIRARTIQRDILRGQAGAVAEATSDEARFKPERGEFKAVYEEKDGQTLKNGLPYDAGPRMLSLEEAQARLDAEDDFNQKADALREAVIKTGPAFPDDPTIQKALEDADLKVDYKHVDPVSDAPVVNPQVHPETGELSAPLPTHAGEYVNGEGRLAETPSDESFTNGTDTAQDQAKIEPSEEADKPKPENPRQPAKKTPAQKRAETIAAKKKAAEK